LYSNTGNNLLGGKEISSINQLFMFSLAYSQLLLIPSPLTHDAVPIAPASLFSTSCCCCHRMPQLIVCYINDFSNFAAMIAVALTLLCCCQNNGISCSRCRQLIVVIESKLFLCHYCLLHQQQLHHCRCHCAVTQSCW